MASIFIFSDWTSPSLPYFFPILPPSPSSPCLSHLVCFCLFPLTLPSSHTQLSSDPSPLCSLSQLGSLSLGSSHHHTCRVQGHRPAGKWAQALALFFYLAHPWLSTPHSFCILFGVYTHTHTFRRVNQLTFCLPLLPGGGRASETIADMQEGTLAYLTLMPVNKTCLLLFLSHTLCLQKAVLFESPSWDLPPKRIFLASWSLLPLRLFCSVFPHPDHTTCQRMKLPVASSTYGTHIPSTSFTHTHTSSPPCSTKGMRPLLIALGVLGFLFFVSIICIQLSLFGGGALSKQQPVRFWTFLTLCPLCTS